MRLAAESRRRLFSSREVGKEGMKMVRPENVGDGRRESRRETKKEIIVRRDGKMKKRDRMKKLRREDRRGKKKGKEGKAVT